MMSVLVCITFNNAVVYTVWCTNIYLFLLPSRLQGRAGSPTPTTPASQPQPFNMMGVSPSPLHMPLPSFAATPLPTASIPVMPHSVSQPLVVAGTVTTAAKQVSYSTHAFMYAEWSHDLVPTQVPSNSSDGSRKVSHSEIYKRQVCLLRCRQNQLCN